MYFKRKKKEKAFLLHSPYLSQCMMYIRCIPGSKQPVTKQGALEDTLRQRHDPSQCRIVQALLA